MFELRFGLTRRGEEEGGTYVYGYEDVEPVVLLPHLHVVVEFLGVVVAHDQRVLGQFLEETLRC